MYQEPLEAEVLRIQSMYLKPWGKEKRGALGFSFEALSDFSFAFFIPY